MERPESIALYYTEGSSDKVYQAQLEEVEGGWVVRFQFGARGKALKAGQKTDAPLTHAAAKVVYDTLVASKTKKGYTPEESGAAYAGTERAGVLTDFRPQLLNDIAETDVAGLIDIWGRVACQTKHDGERRGVLDMDGALTGANRSGLAVGCQAAILDAAARVRAITGADFDGEDMGDHLVIFDILSWQGIPVTDLTFADRAIFLEQLDESIRALNLEQTLRVDLPVWAETREALAAFIAENRARNEEGVVFRNPDAAYAAGRPNSGGNALKLKFYENATVRVAAITPGKRSVSMEVQNDEGVWIGVGSVTIPANFSIPPVGALAEVRYLYAYPAGALFQPVYKGPRTDVGEEAARRSQLKFRKGL